MRRRRHRGSVRIRQACTEGADGDGVSAGGVVYLVGAGPGDPGLMTARSLALIAGADAIFYDRLIPPGALDGAREDAELVYVGKQPGVPVGAAGGDRRAAGRGRARRAAASCG